MCTSLCCTHVCVHPCVAQMWSARISLLVHMRRYKEAEEELEPFKEMDNPDLYYQYHFHNYPDKCGKHNLLCTVTGACAPIVFVHCVYCTTFEMHPDCKFNMRTCEIEFVLTCGLVQRAHSAYVSIFCVPGCVWAHYVQCTCLSACGYHCLNVVHCLATLAFSFTLCIVHCIFSVVYIHHHF